MADLERFYNLLFEVSNEYRHRMMMMLKEKAMRVTTLSKELGLTAPEISRHISRLSENGLATKDVEGYFHLTPFGMMILVLLQEFEFTSKHSEYFVSHINVGVPDQFIKRIGDLSESQFSDSIPDFFRQIEQVIKDAEEEVWLLVDQFPLNHLSFIVEAIDRGVRFRIIEPRDRVLNPDLDAMAPEVSHALSRTKLTPLVEQRMLDEVNVFMYLSEKCCVSTFPTMAGENEYKGFISTDEKSLKWSRDLFQHYWNEGDKRTLAPTKGQIRRGEISETVGYSGEIVVVGRQRPEFDAQAIQDAVDNYDDVVLKGRFDIGTSTIHINRSVILRGEGRKNNIPDTKVWKKGWTFPFIDEQFMFCVRGEGIDVTIENIHVEDFNGTCIGSYQFNSLIIKRNRITIQTGLGRGLSFGPWGDHVVGITAGGESAFRGSGLGGILIEENYLDFALSFARGYTTNQGLERKPDYRPNLKNHEAPICIGINLNRTLGKVIIRNNIIRNMNARGIYTFDNWATADIKIVNNIISSDVFGAYPYNNPMSGIGILVQSAWSEPRSGGRVEVNGNKIACNKVNYCGVAVHGPAMYQKGTGKLEKCIIRDNEIEDPNKEERFYRGHQQQIHR
jgi:predicted transcriptional regulator